MKSTIAAIVAVLAIAAATMWPGLTVGPSPDASVFSTVGWRLAEGDSLYAEIWDHKPPALYLPFVVARLLTSDPSVAWVVVWVLSVVSVAVMAWAVRSILLRSGVDAIAATVGAALAALGAGTYLLSLGGGMGETLALAPMSLAVVAATRGRWLAAGLLGGLALVVSVQVASVLVVLALLRPRLPFLYGLVGVGVATIVALALNGGLGSAFDAVIGYSSAYRAVSTAGAATSVWSLVPWTVLVLLPLLIGAGLAWVGRRRLTDASLSIACLAWLVVGVVLIVVQGRFYAHYATPLVMPLALLAGLGVGAARGRLLVLAPLALGVPLALVVGAAGAADEQRPILASAERVEAVADALDADGSLLVWGNDARLYELAALRPAVRYPYLYPLLTPGYVTPALVSELLASLEASPPAFVVDSGSLEPGAPGLPPLLMARAVATDGRNLDLLDPVRAWVEARYELDGIVGGWPVYRLAP